MASSNTPKTTNATIGPLFFLGGMTGYGRYPIGGWPGGGPHDGCGGGMTGRGGGIGPACWGGQGCCGAGGGGGGGGPCRYCGCPMGAGMGGGPTGRGGGQPPGGGGCVIA
ncbi:hypothetical protein Lesp02_80770 [Lentzea sp. NBRC 105346]|nr:hypothetical protein Lesp02_80770 [Lentzea sp. NBRC 105346]